MTATAYGHLSGPSQKGAIDRLLAFDFAEGGGEGTQELSPSPSSVY